MECEKHNGHVFKYFLAYWHWYNAPFGHFTFFLFPRKGKHFAGVPVGFFKAPVHCPAKFRYNRN